MTEPKTHQDCPHCGHKECYTVFPDGGYYCHSCGAKSGGKPLEIEERNFETIRGIDKKVCEFYGTTVDYDSLGNAVRHTYPYPHAEKYRYLPKDFSKNKGFTTDHLFGQDKFNPGCAKYITIVEGELDAMSAYQILGNRWPVVSLPSASISRKLLQNVHEYLNSFESIVICTDGDDAGKKASDTLCEAFPGKVWRVKLEKHKDANAFLQAGDEASFKWSWVNRERYVPSNVYNNKSDFDSILDDDETNTFIPTPIEDFNKLCKGLMQGHLTVITGPEGQGKTEVMRLLEADILMNHDIPIAVLHMEESKKTCLLSLASYVLGINLRDPEHGVPQEDIKAAIDKVNAKKNLFLFELGIDEDPLSIMDKVRMLTSVYGCRYIFIDPIQQLSYGKDKDSTEEQVLTKISVQLERIATEFNVGIVCTTHVNDDGQTRSSRMIGKSASVRIDLQRDHMNPDPDIRNQTKLMVSKNRPVGPTGFAGVLEFDPDSFTLKEMV